MNPMLPHPGIRGSRSGLALILVLTVIMALAVIATPFVLSMIMQERTAVAERARHQAGYGAEGVRNFAVALLYRGAEGIERKSLEQGKEGTPYLDEPAEFTVEIRDARLKDLKVRDPKGLLWGVTATDEQGKLNVVTTPERVTDNLRASVSLKVVDVKDFLTVYSGRSARWVRPQKIREIGLVTNPQLPTGVKMNGLRVDNAMQLGMGVKVRATRPGLKPFEAKVVRNGVYYMAVHAIETEPPIPATYLNGLLEIELRHPVNVNTARRETMAAMYDGMAISVPNPGATSFKTYKMSSEDGRKIADGLYKKSISTWHQFVQEALNLDVDDLAKAAVIVNAVDPGNLILTDGNEGLGALPFCFTSNETVTIEALAAMNTDAGTTQGAAGFREVIDLGCPTVVTKSWENQFDFDRFMGPPRLLVSTTGVVPNLPKPVADALNASGILGGSYLGYPYGARMETFPKDLDHHEPSEMLLKAQQPPNTNFISMRTDRDHRGQGGLFKYIEHFDEELDGHKIDVASHDLEHAKVFAPTDFRADVNSGGTEFWIRFDQPVGNGTVKMFDIRESDTSNRISVEVVINEIVFRITDGTQGVGFLPVDKGWSEIRAPFAPEKDTWYHIAAYWKGTKYGQMLLMVDGFVPKKAKWRHVDVDNGMPMFTELSSVLNKPDPSAPFTTIPLKDTSWMSKPTHLGPDDPWIIPLQIGNEVVEYDTKTGLGRRSARVADSVYGAQLIEHPQDAKVTVFGYTSTFRKYNVGILYQPPGFDPPGELYMQFGGLLPTEGKTALRHGMPQDTFLVGEDQDSDGNMVLNDSNIRIKYMIPDESQWDNTEWPDSGFVVIEGEAIYYENMIRETLKTGYFENCQRGMEGTVAAIHQSGLGIYCWSVAVNKLDTKLSVPTIIQVKEEWFGPVNRPMSNPAGPHEFWVGCIVNGRPVPLMRGWNWMIEPVRHIADEPIIPLFAAREVDPQIRRTNLGRYDSVTVVNRLNSKETHQVCRQLTIEELNQWLYMQNPMGGNPPPPPMNVADQGFQLAAMFAQAKQEFPDDGINNRILKWPSGELIDRNFLDLTNPKVMYGPAKATLDEVKNVASAKGDFRLTQLADKGVVQFEVINSQLLNGSQMVSGAILAGEEVIGFARYDNNGKFLRCKRAYLNSTEELHNAGDPIFVLNFLPIAAIDNDPLAGDGRRVPLSQVLAGQGYNRGYILVDNEVIGFEEVGDTLKELDCLARFDGGGLFRGMFGTSVSGHSPHTMVFGIPFRYWDGYKRGEFDNRMPYFQVASTTRNARWRELRYQIEVGQGDPNLLPHCYVRIDGLGDMTQPLDEDHSAVWHYFKNQTNSLNDYISSRLENGQIEARFFLEYKPGSFWPENSWKRTMKVHEVRIDYDRDTKVLLHEDK